MEANAAAWPCTQGSEAECWERTDCRIERKRGFSARESGVGGILVVVPTERLRDGGFVGRRVRICDVDGEDGLGKTYYERVSC